MRVVPDSATEDPASGTDGGTASRALIDAENGSLRRQYKCCQCEELNAAKNFIFAIMIFLVVGSEALFVASWFRDVSPAYETLFLSVNYTITPMLVVFTFGSVLWDASERTMVFSSRTEAYSSASETLSLRSEFCFVVILACSLLNSAEDIIKHPDTISTSNLLWKSFVCLCFIFLIFGARQMLRQLCREMLEYKGPNFAPYVRLTVLPVYVALALFQLFVAMSMIAQGQQALYYKDFMEIPSTWSAGYGALGVNFNSAGTSILWAYLYGAGILRPGEFGRYLFKAPLGDEASDTQRTRTKRLAMLEFLFLVDVWGMTYCFSYLYTSCDFTGNYPVVFFGMICWLVAVVVVYKLRASSNQGELPYMLWNTGKKHHFFVSHAQGNGGDQAQAITQELRQFGCEVWRDMDASDLTTEGMKNGINNSVCVLLFLTDGVLARPFVQMEIRHALSLEKPLIVVAETDVRHGAPSQFADFITQSPDDLKVIFESFEVISYRRRKWEAEAMYKEIIERLRAGYLATAKQRPESE